MSPISLGVYGGARTSVTGPTGPEYVLEATGTYGNTLTSTSHTLGISGTPGSLIVATIGVDKNASSIAVSSGWTLAKTYISASTGGAIAIRWATGDDDITWTLGASRGVAATYSEFSGFTSMPSVVATGQSSTGETNVSVVSADAGSGWAGLAVASGGQDTLSANVVWTTTVSNDYLIATFDRSGNTGASTHAAYKQVSATDSTSITYDFQGSSDQSHAIIVVLSEDA